MHKDVIVFIGCTVVVQVLTKEVYKMGIVGGGAHPRGISRLAGHLSGSPRTEHSVEADPYSMASTAMEHTKNVWGFVLAAYDALSDAVMTLIGFVLAILAWTALELGPAVAVTYLNGGELWKLLTEKGIGALNWAEIGTALAVAVLALSAWRRFVRERKNLADWKKVLDVLDV